MIRITTLCAAAAVALALAPAAGLAQEKPAGEVRMAEPRNDAGEKNLESIADEVSEVGATSREEDGMDKAVAETEGAEEDDTCIRADGEVGCELAD